MDDGPGSILRTSIVCLAGEWSGLPPAMNPQPPSMSYGGRRNDMKAGCTPDTSGDEGDDVEVKHGDEEDGCGGEGDEGGRREVGMLEGKISRRTTMKPAIERK